MEFLEMEFTDADKMVWLLFIVVLFAINILYKKHKDPNQPNFDLTDLLMEGGHVSKTAVFLCGSYILTTWMMMRLTINGKMTEGYFSIYIGAWIAPILVKILKGDPEPPKTDRVVVEEKKAT